LIRSCKAGDGPVGHRSTCSDARVGYHLSDFRPGLVPVLRRASAPSWPLAIAREFPTVGPSPASHDSRLRLEPSIADVEPISPDHAATPGSGRGATCLAIAQRKAAISRAIATTTTVLRLPLASRRLNRPHSRVCAFQAMSRTRRRRRRRAHARRAHRGVAPGPPLLSPCEGRPRPNTGIVRTTAGSRKRRFDATWLGRFRALSRPRAPALWK
jgi:hypothetical protein